MEYTNGSLLVKNCNFTKIIHNKGYYFHIINSKIQANNVAIKFQNCAFYYNVAFEVLTLNFPYYYNFWPQPSNVTIENCIFIGNNVTRVIMMKFYAISMPQNKANVFFNNLIIFANNEVNVMMRFEYLSVTMNGTITVLENDVNENIIEFELCEMTFTNSITFLSNIYDTVIYISYDIRYIIIIEYANITFANNTYQHNNLFVSGLQTRNYIDVFPHCIFQYMALPSIRFNISELHQINFTGNH